MKIFDSLKETKVLRVSDGKTIPFFNDCKLDSRLLVLLWSQLGDFDTLEYAWWLNKNYSEIIVNNVTVKAIGIGDRDSGLKFCDYTNFPQENLFVDPDATIHEKLGLYEGLTWNIPALNQSQNAWVNLMLMCAGIGSKGTLKEVLRGYTGDKKAPQLIDNEEVVDTNLLPPLKGSFFNVAGGEKFQRPFELATLRLRNMTEVLSNWKTYVPNAAYLTQRGATFLFDENGELLYEYRDQGILGFSENMSNPLSFLSVNL
ncbi:peroxiredoxin-like family protein [Crocosphaera sp.]|uniref:peroxiredoxin-like family protein n=1 Tax=Crocosphaera sp. TaxID=2729996 RepID=UPI002627E26B|nr:peroxiredoxin-like family protein [Crocosphaera sp.]MDJ0579374.1 peroxiredoxin-like family protein [Crocosphaera sp.]